MTLHQRLLPGESDVYRRARDELLQAEIELRRQEEAVAAQRRRLPLGGVVPEDYVFEECAAGRSPTPWRASSTRSPAARARTCATSTSCGRSGPCSTARLQAGRPTGGPSSNTEAELAPAPA